MKHQTKKDIIYFDGACGLCDFFVQYIYTRDKKKKFSFAPLQGKTAKKNLPKKYIDQLNTVVLETYGQDTQMSRDAQVCRDAQVERLYFTKSTAALKILSQLPSHSWMKIFWIVPKPLRDFGYDIISKTRKTLFPAKKCIWKTLENSRILD